MKKILALVVALLLLPASALAAIAFDNSCGAVASAATASCTLTITSSNSATYAMSQLNSGHDNDAGCTAGGTAMTKIATVHDSHAGSLTYWYVYYIAGKSGSTAITCSQSVDTNALRLVVMTYSGANQSMVYSGGSATDAISLTATATTTTSVSTSVTPISANSWIGSFGLQFTDTNTAASTNLTLRQKSTGSLFNFGGDSNGIKSGATTQTWTTGVNADWSAISFSISPVPTAAAATAITSDLIFFN